MRAAFGPPAFLFRREGRGALDEAGWGAIMPPSRSPRAAVARWGPHGAGWSSLVARRAHNPEVAGSNPAPATNPTTGAPIRGAPDTFPSDNPLGG